MENTVFNMDGHDHVYDYVCDHGRDHDHGHGRDDDDYPPIYCPSNSHLQKDSLNFP